MFTRIALFVLTNIAIIAVFMVITSVFGIDTMYLKPNGLDLKALAFISLFFGFAGSFLSLFMSKWIAKWTMKVQVIKDPKGTHEQKLMMFVQRIAQENNIKTPEVGIYESAEVNAFATGASKNGALVAVSSGLLQNMTDDEVEGVVAHEMAHILNGDMVTMTLLQGVINTFVIFFARVAAFGVQKALGRDNEEIGGLAYLVTSIIFEIFFSILASTIVMAFSRHREFNADAGGAKYAGKAKMIATLKKLQTMQGMVDISQKNLATMKIAGGGSHFGKLFMSHPPLEKRIEALQMAPIN